MTALDVLSPLGPTVLDVTPTAPAPAQVDPVTGRRLVPFTGTDDPDLGAREQLHVIADDLANAPRTLQVALGPSEVGHACPRRIAYGLLQYPDLNPSVGWLPGIGTAVHEQNGLAFRAVNARLREETGQERYLIEHPVSVPTPTAREFAAAGEELTGVQRVVAGHLDLFDVALGEVTDWKIVGKTTLTKVKAGKVDQGYLAQQLIYGRGLQDQGFEVRRLRLHFLPRNDPDLHRASRAHTWDVTPEELIEGSDRVLARFDRIADGVEQLGPAVLGQLDPVDANCSWCPFYSRGSTDPMGGCPGADAVSTREVSSQARQLRGLIPG